MVERARLESVWLLQGGSRVRISPSPPRYEDEFMERVRVLAVFGFQKFRKNQMPLTLLWKNGITLWTLKKCGAGH